MTPDRRGLRGTLRLGRRRATPLASLAAVCLLLAACASPPQPRYFRVEVPPPGPVAGPALPVTLGVARVQAPEPYRQERIIYQASPYRVEYYPYDRWESSPAEMVDQLLFEQCAASGRFQRVVLWRRDAADYQLQARLLRFEEVDEARDWYGLVELEYEVADGRGRSLLRDITRQRVKADAHTVESIVEALSRGLQISLREMVARTAESLAGARR